METGVGAAGAAGAALGLAGAPPQPARATHSATTQECFIGFGSPRFSNKRETWSETGRGKSQVLRPFYCFDRSPSMKNTPHAAPAGGAGNAGVTFRCIVLPEKRP